VSDAFRIGHGYDLHRLEPCAPAGAGRPFVLGGVAIAHDRGPVGHSDGDALLHAATDAILGALGMPDIGQLFPDTDAAWLGQDSALFVREAAKRMRAAGWEIGNMDMTVICERPKIGHVPTHEARARRALPQGAPILEALSLHSSVKFRRLQSTSCANASPRSRTSSSLRRAVRRQRDRRKDHPNVIVNTHATFRWRHGLFARSTSTRSAAEARHVHLPGGQHRGGAPRLHPSTTSTRR
jgi:2-C-methyl-D-erythritol 2,4-cyclodiphosphate synthase